MQLASNKAGKHLNIQDFKLIKNSDFKEHSEVSIRSLLMMEDSESIASRGISYSTGTYLKS